MKGVRLLLGNGKSIYAKDNFFDIAPILLFLRIWEDPNQVLTEINRVVKSKGRFVLFYLRWNLARGLFRFLTFVIQGIVPKAL